MAASNYPLGIVQGLTAAQWTINNPILEPYLLGIESDTSKTKLGNGSARWNDLGYFIDPSSIAIIPVADGTYKVGLGVSSDGLITVNKGLVTAITQAS